MRRISYVVNSFYQTASVHFTYGPWWSFWLDDIVSWLCGKVPSIPLPRLPIRLWDKEAIDSNGGLKWANLRDWYGYLDNVFELLVCLPVSSWCWKFQDVRSVKVDFQKLKEELRGQDAKFWKAREENEAQKG